jgi:ankyrin repeat protein
MADNALDLDLEDEPPEITTEEYQEMLHKAFRDNNTEEALELLEKDLNMNMEDKDGWTPLAWAAFYGNEVLVKKLLY